MNSKIKKLNIVIQFSRLFLSFLLIIFLSSFRLGKDDGIHASYTAFQPGEELTYMIRYGPLTAGKATFKVKDTILTVQGVEHYWLNVHGRTLSSWDWFYKVRDYLYSIVDTNTLLPTVALRDVREGSYETREKLIFKRSKNVVKSNDKTFQVPDDIHDLLSGLYYGRCIDYSNLKPGAFFPINTFFADTLFPVGATYMGTKTINTRLGTFKCHVVKPKLIQGRIFKGQYDMTIYVSRDKNQVPVRIESAIFVGYIRADLVHYKNLKYPLYSKLDQD